MKCVKYLKIQVLVSSTLKEKTYVISMFFEFFSPYKYVLSTLLEKQKTISLTSLHENVSGCQNLNPLSAKLIKWPNTLKQFVGNLPTNCLSVFGHFVGLALKGLIEK